MLHKNVNELKKEDVPAGKNTSMQILVSSEIAPNFAMRKFTIIPDGFMPLHTNLVEHEQYVLNGEAKVQIGDKSILVQKDDVVFIPAGVEHNYSTIG